MADEPKDKDNPKDDTPGDTDPDKKGKGDNQQFDPSKLSDEDFEKVLEDRRLWNTERLKQLRADSKELKKRVDADSEAEKKRLEEQGEFKKLLQTEKKEREAAEKRIAELELHGAFGALATKKGIQDIDAAIKLANLTEVSKGEDGTYTGLDEAVENLTKERPFLIQTKPPVGNPSNPGGGSGDPTKFTISQISDPKFYQENRDAIMKAQSEGRIVDDRAQPPAS